MYIVCVLQYNLNCDFADTQLNFTHQNKKMYHASHMISPSVITMLPEVKNPLYFLLFA